jgi:hypothetical protein
MFVAVGDSGLKLSSPDGVTWTVQLSTTPKTLYGITFGNNTFVAVGDSGSILTSPNGTTWKVHYIDSVKALYSIAYGDGKFVAVGTGTNRGVILSSSVCIQCDSTAWNKFYPDYGFYGITYGDSTFVAVGGAGTILASSDGTAWAACNSGITTWLNAVTYGNGRFVTVGGQSMILTGR